MVVCLGTNHISIYQEHGNAILIGTPLEFIQASIVKSGLLSPSDCTKAAVNGHLI